MGVSRNYWNDAYRDGEVSVSWIIGDALALPFPDRAFDFVTDRACFHHIPDADRPLYAREVARVLKPGGFVTLRRK